MLEFHKQKPKNPSKTDPEKRIKDFQEIYSQFDNKTSIEQSSRCSQCGVPYCQIHCPLNNNIPDWLKYIAEDRLEEAYQVSSSTNVFPEVCGRVCPQDRLCEGNCVVEQAGFGAITIGNLEKYLTELAWEKGWVKNIEINSSSKKKVAIIGSGPAGMAASSYLIQNGYQVDVFEKNDRVGGLIHKNDLSWTDSNGDRTLKKYQKGQNIEVKIIEIDPSKEKISFGIKQLSADPFNEFFKDKNKGDIVSATITKINNNGIDVEVASFIDTTIRRKELSKNKEEQNISRYNEGQKIDAKISSIDLTNRKFALSIRQLEIDEEQSLLEKYGSKSSGSVLGDILGKALDEDKDTKEQ